MSLSHQRKNETLAHFDELLDKLEIRGQDREQFLLYANMFETIGKMKQIENQIEEKFKKDLTNQ